MCEREESVEISYTVAHSLKHREVRAGDLNDAADNVAGKLLVLCSARLVCLGKALELGTGEAYPSSTARSPRTLLVERVVALALAEAALIGLGDAEHPAPLRRVNEAHLLHSEVCSCLQRHPLHPLHERAPLPVQRCQLVTPRRVDLINVVLRLRQVHQLLNHRLVLPQPLGVFCDGCSVRGRQLCCVGPLRAIIVLLPFLLLFLEEASHGGELLRIVV